MTMDNVASRSGAALDSAHVGDIRGALGTIAVDDVGARRKILTKRESHRAKFESSH